MKQYIELLQEVLEKGVEKPDRTNTGTLSCTGLSKTYDLSKGFPLLWIKKTSFHNIKTELLWFLGNHLKDPKYKPHKQTNIKYLVDNGVNIWNAWAYEPYKKFYGQAGFSTDSFYSCVEDVCYKDLIEIPDDKDPNLKHYRLPTLDEFKTKVKGDSEFARRWGRLGPIYGKQWRDWNGLDQIADVIESIEDKPYDRGHIVSAWNLSDLHKMELRPCHVLFQFIVSEGKLDLVLYQRSGDLFLGIPYNIASYSLLLAMVAQITGYTPGKFVHMIGDAHIYKNHIEQTQEVIKRWKNNQHFELPNLKLNKNINHIDNFTLSDIEIENYNHYDFISAPVAV